MSGTDKNDGTQSPVGPATADGASGEAGTVDPADAAIAALDLAGQVRLVEALLFAAPEPMTSDLLRRHLPEASDLGAILAQLAERYAASGVDLVETGAGWSFRTAEDLAPLLRRERPAPRKLSRAALETLAAIAYHQTERPLTRVEIETIRGVALSKGTLDLLMEAGFIRPGRRRMTPGRPLTWVVTKEFLDHFGLKALDELPGLDELRQAGLLDARPALATLPGGRLDDLIDPDGGEDGLPTADGDDGTPLFDALDAAETEAAALDLGGEDEAGLGNASGDKRI